MGPYFYSLGLSTL